METIILQVVVFQLCFLVAYEILFRKETFFNWNRGYLLITSIASLLLPFVKLKSFSKVIPSEFFVNLPTVILGKEKVASSTIVENLDAVAVHTNSISFSVVWIWYAGILMFGCVLFFKLYKIWRYKQTNNSVQKSGYSITTLKNSEDAFSFLKSIFLGDKIENTQKESILKHERVHVEEKHTIDLLWFELMRIVFWFNPLVYIYQKRITEVHEFIADKSASKQQQNYYENLLAKTFNIAQFSLVNQFYSSSLIKKRIIMLTKEKSNKRKLVKYITIIPIVLSMLVYVSCTDALEVENSTETVVSLESTVMEDVLRITNETFDLNKSMTSTTTEQRANFNNKIKEYYFANKSKIKSLDLDKYAQYYSVREKVDLPIKDLMCFLSTEVSMLGMFDAIEHEKELLALQIRNKHYYTRLNELNFKLPNENLYKEAYEKAVREGMAEVTNSVNYIFEGDSFSFNTISQAPIYPGCDENATPEELKKCFSRGIAIHINENFNTDIAKTHNLIGKQRIVVKFKVNKNGQVIDIKARAPHEALKTEAIRVIKTLPALKPGMHDGKAVAVNYSIPVIFMIE
jgi:beta-lactamase regulating signal transducer with metallopeptidase domain